MLGSASVTDFSIGDDPARKGELFVASVEQKNFGRTVPGKESAALIMYRRAGEPTPKRATGTMTWKDGMMAGSARGAADDGEAVELSWECQAP